MFRLTLFLILFTYACLASAQTPVLRPKPITVNLANPKASLSDLTKEEKQRFKQLQKEQKQLKKEKKKYFKKKLDSLMAAEHLEYQAKEALDTMESAQKALELWDEKDPYVNLISKGRKIDLLKDSLENKHGIKTDSSQFSEFKKLETIHSDSSLVLNQFDSAYLLNEIDSATYFHLLDSTYAVNDSLQQWKKSLPAIDSLDTLNQRHYTEKAIADLEPRSEALAQKESNLNSADQQQQEMYSSYEEMIQSDKYKDIMENMPGKREEIEEKIMDEASYIQEYPELENVFKGHEKELASAMTAHKIIKEKPTLKSVLSEFFDQDMESVKKEKLKDRFSISGLIQVTSYEPVIIDFSPSIGFAITQKIDLGLGVGGRWVFGDSDPQDLPKDVLAYRAYMDYDIFKGFYFHGEYERTGQMETDMSDNSKSRYWSGRTLLGIGKDIKMPGIFDGNILLLYNLDSETEGSPNPRRIQVRYGIKIQ